MDTTDRDIGTALPDVISWCDMPPTTSLVHLHPSLAYNAASLSITPRRVSGSPVIDDACGAVICSTTRQLLGAARPLSRTRGRHLAAASEVWSMRP
jgi:hypothetical protein